MTDPNFQPAAPQPAGVPLTQAEDKQWAAYSHLGGIIGILPALIIWLVFKDRGPLTNQEGKEALNFQITVLLASIAWVIVGSILTAVTLGIFSIIQLLVSLAIWVVAIIFSVQGFSRVNNGGTYRYPFALRLIK